jgi:tetratricopeptide (TPR) repeat protein
LGISHPAGFPTYNLLVKAFTFLPLGSIAFKVNLFSLVFACLTLVLLYLLINLFLEFLFGREKPLIIVSIFPVLLLAFSKPFWYHALVAEVYTLHAFLTCLIFYLLMQWKMKEDVRFLFAAAFVYGLSAGNHATVVFYLPAIVLLYLAWESKSRYKNFLVSSLIFLIGFSVYLYLPIRSLAEPTIDWGNPENLQGFLYHVTDRQHSDTHFDELSTGKLEEENTIENSLSSLGANTFYVLKMLTLDLNKQLTALTVMGFFAGALLCFKINRPLFYFFSIIVAVNASFFVGWRGESYFPTYIVACLWTSALLFWLVQEKPNITNNPDHSSKTHSGLRGGLWFQNLGDKKMLVSLILVGCVMWLVSSNFSKVDRTDNYFAESLLKRMILSLDDNSIFVAGISWFNSAYHQDVMRLRDDVTFLKAWDFLDTHPPSLMSSKRHPNLQLPNHENYQFNSRKEAFSYVTEFFDQNAKVRPLLIEQNYSFLQAFPLAEKLVPHSNLLLRYLPENESPENILMDPKKGFGEFQKWLEEELALSGAQNESAWIEKVSFYIPSFAAYFHAKGYYKEEREVLKVMHEFLGNRGVVWHLKVVDNLILDGKLGSARKNLEAMKVKFPELFETDLMEGLLFSREGDPVKALQSFKAAAEKNPKSFRPYFEAAEVFMTLGSSEKANQALEKAKARVVSLGELNQVQERFEQLSSL